MPCKSMQCHCICVWLRMCMYLYMIICVYAFKIIYISICICICVCVWNHIKCMQCWLESPWLLQVSALVSNCKGMNTQQNLLPCSEKWPEIQLTNGYKWRFPKIVVPPNGWFVVEIQLKWLIFWGSPISGNLQKQNGE